MNKILQRIFWLPLFLFLQLPAFTQITIKGPVCVMPGTVYQYNIHGGWAATSSMQVCITGGKIADSTITSRCTVTSAPLGSVSVIWSPQASGSLSITSSKGNTSLSVSITFSLQPGLLDSTSHIQMISSDSIPITISCPPATGGSCSPLYAYQWQQCADAVNWTDISGAMGQNLSFSSPLSETSYFRRKVVETGSGTVGYSGFATIVKR